MADSGSKGYASVLTQKLALQNVALENEISVIVSQSSEVNEQQAIQANASSAVGDGMTTCMDNATTGMYCCMAHVCSTVFKDAGSC